MKIITFLVLVVSILTGCGGGGSSSPTYGLAWSNATYTIDTTGANTTISVNGNLTVSSSTTLPDLLSVNISPLGVQTNPTVGNGPFWMNTTHQVPVQFSVAPDIATGVYPIGNHDFTATMTIGTTAYTAKTTVIVK